MFFRAAAIAAVCATSAAPLAPASAPPFAGSWLGTLEYRDYSNDARVSLPTLLTVGRRDGAFVFLYTYDDGNGKVVRDRETVTVDPTAGTYVVDDGTPGERDVYRIDARDGFTGERTGGTFVALGSGTENGAPVDVRETVGITPTVLTMLRETRPKGTAAAFAFRHRYRFSRITAQP
jgi:hypothetical protein